MTQADYFISKYPEEAVGYLKNGVFYPVENTAEDKLNDCVFDGVILIDKPDVIIHSHPRTEDNKDQELRSPSDVDLHNQIITACEWAICVVEQDSCSEPIYWGNYDHRPPLKDREFIYNVQDCLSYIQDWYYINHGIKLPNCARSVDWDVEGKRHMDDLYADWGFTKEVPIENARAGDLLMFRFLSDTTNHLAIYDGDGYMSWHCEGQVPHTLLVGKHTKRLARVVRHEVLQ